MRHSRRLSGAIRRATRSPAPRWLATAVRPKTYQLWRAALRAATERAENARALLSAAGDSHEAPREQRRQVFGQQEDMLIFGSGDLAPFSADYIRLITNLGQVPPKLGQTWRAKRFRKAGIVSPELHRDSTRVRES